MTRAGQVVSFPSLPITFSDDWVPSTEPAAAVEPTELAPSLAARVWRPLAGLLGGG